MTNTRKNSATTNMNKFLEYFLLICFIMLLLFTLGWILITGLYNNEVVECLKWQTQEANYPLFYSTQWQKEQCHEHNIELTK